MVGIPMMPGECASGRWLPKKAGLGDDKEQNQVNAVVSLAHLVANTDCKDDQGGCRQSPLVHTETQRKETDSQGEG